MKRKHLILLRGLPGAGKSLLAEILSENNKYPFYSVDDYFTNDTTNEYVFDFSKNHLAYKLCEKNTKQSMERGDEKIIIHNTFTMGWELDPYFKLASNYDYNLFVVTVENYHNTGNLHQINEEQLKKMAIKYNVKLM